MANVVGCDTVVSKSELQSHNYIHCLEKGMNPTYPPAMG